MSENTPDEQDQYEVVVNHEEQYSIWPADRELPAGWSLVGKRGPKDQCLDHIEQVWTDMRPLSLRRQMEQDELKKHP
jgi:MbtH protein